MNEEEKKNENEVTDEGAVEVKEEDLDKASGGAGYLKTPVDRGVENPTSPTLRPGEAQPPDNLPNPNYDLKKI